MGPPQTLVTPGRRPQSLPRPGWHRIAGSPPPVTRYNTHHGGSCGEKEKKEVTRLCFYTEPSLRRHFRKLVLILAGTSGDCSLEPGSRGGSGGCAVFWSLRDGRGEMMGVLLRVGGYFQGTAC